MRKKAGHLQPSKPVPRAARWRLGLRLAPGGPGALRLRRDPTRAPEALRRDSGTSAPGDYLRPPPSSPIGCMAFVRPVRPYEGLRAGPRRQWDPGRIPRIGGCLPRGS